MTGGSLSVLVTLGAESEEDVEVAVVVEVEFALPPAGEEELDLAFSVVPTLSTITSPPVSEVLYEDMISQSNGMSFPGANDAETANPSPSSMRVTESDTAVETRGVRKIFDVEAT